MKRAAAAFLATAIALLFCAGIAPRVSAAQPSVNHSRALVLGGGGPVGIGWETGLLAGLASKGADVANADMIIGTSAGSVVGAEVALGHSPEQMLTFERAHAKPSRRASEAPPNLRPLFMKLREMAAGKQPPDEVRKEIGQWAMKTHTKLTQAQFLAIFERILPDAKWPLRPYECATVNTSTGKLQVWNRTSDVPLARAVASSCAVPGIFPPIEIKGQHYMDGGMHSPTNAELAKGYKKVLIVDVTAPAHLTAANRRFARGIEREEQFLRNSGSQVILITPDAASHKAFGRNLMDSSHRAAAAEAGYAEGRAQAARVAAIWNQ